MTRHHRLAAGLTALAVSAAVPAAALGHAAVDKTYPSKGATVSTSIKRVSVTFDEAVTTGTLSVKTGGGAAVPVTVKQKGAKITGTLKRTLSAGRYKVSWRAVADDGHKESGSFSFKVK